ncbi:uncharacterized protein B0T23DRAFT_389114, partial [Neurospora hispaniola]
MYACNAAKVQSEPTYIHMYIRAVSLPSPRDRTTPRSRPWTRHTGKPKLQSYFHRVTSSSSPAHRRIYVCRCISGEYVHISSKRNVTSPTHAFACLHYAHTYTHTIRTLTNQIALLVYVVIVYRIRCIQVVVLGMGGNHNHMHACDCWWRRVVTGSDGPVGDEGLVNSV